MDKGLIPLSKFLFVDASVAAYEEAPLGSQSRITDDGVAEYVDFFLGAAHGVYHTEPAGRTLYWVHFIDYKGIFPMIVEAGVSIQRVVFRRI